MVIPRHETEVSVSLDWVIFVKITHKPTGLVGYGRADKNSRLAYALALKDLETKLSSRYALV